MRNKKETLSIDTRLQRILRNEYPEIHNICRKLEKNDNNMLFLSNTERDQVWSYIKNLLKSDQKLDKLKLKRNGTSGRLRECNVSSETYSSVVRIALETLKFKNIPTALPDVLKLLNSGLPKINDRRVKDEVSSFLENCWKLKLTKEEQFIVNVLKYLAECAKISVEHINRLNNIRDAIHLLKSFEDIQDMMKLAREETLLMTSEGRDLLVYLFTIGEHWIMGIYNNIRVSLQTADYNNVKTYANIIMKAWQNTNSNKKTIEDCLENLIFHCLRARRDINGRHKLGTNLLIFLECFHKQSNENVKRMICDQYFQFIWRCLEAPGCCVRCNAADVLFLAYPMSISSRIVKNNTKLKKKSYLNKQHNAITNLLKDSNEKVCIIAIKGMFHILKNFWTDIPSKVIDEWLNLALEHTKSSNFQDIRKNVFQGLKCLLSNPQSKSKLKKILPKFVDSIYDSSVDVKLEVLELFLQIKSIAKNQIWNIVPLNCIIECLDTTTHVDVVTLLHKLLWIRFSASKDEEGIVQEVIIAAQININVIRKFFLHAKTIISYKQACKLINIILSTITQEIELITEKEINEEVRVKRHKLSLNTEEELCEGGNILSKKSFTELSTVKILIDVSALLYVVNREELLKDSFKGNVKELNLKIADKIYYILEKFEDMQLNETALFFLSLIPEHTLKNHKEFSEKCKRKLLEQNVSDDTILSILHLLIKWNNVDNLLEILPSLLNVDENLYEKLKSFVHLEVTNVELETERRIRMLKLGVRILQFIFQTEFQSYLIQKHYENMIQFWENLHFIKTLIVNRFAINNEQSLLSDDLLKVIFTNYISLIPLLHHSDDFRSSNHFSRIVTWAQEEIVFQASNLSNLETDDFFINILKCILDTSTTMIAQFKASPKLCCEVIILYSKCLITKCGIAFVNHALVTILALMKFSNAMYNNDESELLKAVTPSLFAAVMVTLTKYPEELVKKYTNNFKSFVDSVKSIFFILNHPLNRDVLCLGYMAIIFNAAIFCVSKDFEKLLSRERSSVTDILNQETSFIAEEIVKIISHVEGFQDLCINVWNEAVSKYNKIDQLSSLLVIQRLVKSRNKMSVKKRKRIQNIISSLNEENQESVEENSSILISARLISDAKKKVIEEILTS